MNVKRRSDKYDDLKIASSDSVNSIFEINV